MIRHGTEEVLLPNLDRNNAFLCYAIRLVGIEHFKNGDYFPCCHLTTLLCIDEQNALVLALTTQPSPISTRAVKPLFYKNENYFRFSALSA